MKRDVRKVLYGNFPEWAAGGGAVIESAKAWDTQVAAKKAGRFLRE